MCACVVAQIISALLLLITPGMQEALRNFELTAAASWPQPLCCKEMRKRFPPHYGYRLGGSVFALHSLWHDCRFSTHLYSGLYFYSAFKGDLFRNSFGNSWRAYSVSYRLSWCGRGIGSFIRPVSIVSFWWFRIWKEDWYVHNLGTFFKYCLPV